MANSLWFGSVHSSKGIQHRAATALWAVLDAQGMITNNVTPQPVCLASEEVGELPVRQLPWVFGLEVTWDSLAATEAPSHSWSQGTGDILGWMGRVLCSLQSGEWIPYVCRGGKCGVGCPVVISLLDMFWCQALRGGLLGERETERKEVLLSGAVSCWMFCGNQHVNVLWTMQKWEGFKCMRQSCSVHRVMCSFSVKVFIIF